MIPTDTGCITTMTQSLHMPRIAEIYGADLSEEPIAGGSAFCPASIAAKYSPHLASEEQLT